MILKGFKEKSIKKHINKLLLERNAIFSDNKIESLGVICHLDEVDDLDLFNKLAARLNVQLNKLKIIAFASNKEMLKSCDNCYKTSDFNRDGTLKNKELQAFLSTEFDVLISYYQVDIVELKLLTAASKAPLKVGSLQTDERLNDIIIKIEPSEFDVFEDEVFKYLTVLNKIKNE